MIAADRGLVLRTHKLRETSKIVSALGFAHGRVRLVAHAGRGPQHRFGASLEVGNEVDIVYSLAPNRDLGTLREATLVRAWLAGGARLEAMGTGLAILELLDRLVPEGAGEPGLGEEAAEALAATREAADRAGALLVFYGFELRLLARLGLQPALAACAGCGAAAGQGPGSLDVQAGAFRCRHCAGTGPGRLAVPADVSTILAELTCRAPGELGSLSSSPRARRLVGVCLHRLMSAHLERYRYPRSLDLLKKVDRGGVDGGLDDATASFPATA